MLFRENYEILSLKISLRRTVAEFNAVYILLAQIFLETIPFPALFLKRARKFRPRSLT